DRRPALGGVPVRLAGRLASDRLDRRDPDVRSRRAAAPPRRSRAVRAMSFSVVRALGLCTVQDLGRPGRMPEAVARGGGLVAERLVAANRAVGNPDDAPALEVLGQLAIRAERAIEIATDTTAARSLAAGGELVVASEPLRVAYLAVRGGIAAPLVLGGRGVLLCAGLGGLVRPGQRFELAGLAEIAARCSTPA